MVNLAYFKIILQVSFFHMFEFLDKFSDDVWICDFDPFAEVIYSKSKFLNWDKTTACIWVEGEAQSVVGGDT